MVAYLAGFVESWGRGYEKIQGQFELANLPMPTFEVARGGVITTIQRANGDITPPVAPPVAPPVKVILAVLEEGELSVKEMMEHLGLSDKRNFKTNYLQPALSLGLVEMTIPDKPNSRLQRYRLVRKL